MASMTKNNGKPMAEDENDDRGEESERDDERDDRDEKDVLPYRAPATAEGGKRAAFFTIYKSGQGYWTRMCTAGGAAIILLATVIWLYQYLPTWVLPAFDHSGTIADASARAAAANHAQDLANRVTLIVCAAVFVAYCGLVFWLMNKPSNADFLIATDSEMKKVNWTTRADLIGSTKVVIFFVIIVTALLFVTDILFGYFFYFVGVLKSRPF